MAGTTRLELATSGVTDDPTACSFLVPSVVRRGDLIVAISTGGGSPALAKKLRQRLEQTIGPEYEAFVAALRLLRERVRRAVPATQDRQAIYRQAVESDLFELAARGDADAVSARIEDLVTRPPRARAGAKCAG